MGKTWSGQPMPSLYTIISKTTTICSTPPTPSPSTFPNPTIRTLSGFWWWEGACGKQCGLRSSRQVSRWWVRWAFWVDWGGVWVWRWWGVVIFRTIDGRSPCQDAITSRLRSLLCVSQCVIIYVIMVRYNVFEYRNRQTKDQLSSTCITTHQPINQHSYSYSL